ncbi:hypothetical protein [Mycobacterium phage Kashi_VT1]|nr:hypothetical protein [Mycobacterium phage Kashi_VT1]UVD40998.1 hypothetical protein [Mycobacterium phage Kashi_RDG1]
MGGAGRQGDSGGPDHGRGEYSFHAVEPNRRGLVCGRMPRYRLAYASASRHTVERCLLAQQT